MKCPNCQQDRIIKNGATVYRRSPAGSGIVIATDKAAHRADFDAGRAAQNMAASTIEGRPLEAVLAGLGRQPLETLTHWEQW